MATIVLPTRMTEDQISDIREIRGDASPLPLLEELLSLGVEPFSQQSVDEYKAVQVKANRVRIGVRFYENDFDTWSTRSKFIASAAIAIASFAALFALMTSSVLLTDYLSYTMSVLVTLLVMFTLAVSVFFFCFQLDKTEIFRVRCKWIRTSLADYHEAVPIKVLGTAARVQAIAGVRLEVDYLYSEDKVLLDPFLVVCLGDEAYELEVWGEPDFNSNVLVP